MDTTTAPGDRRRFADLSRTVLGRPLSINDALEWLMRDEFAPSPPETPNESLWLGSIGYERHKNSSDFARHLRRVGVERLVDVRELPISRRRGYAKTALSQAMEREGIDYLHMRGLGNPKPYRDLYKSGKVEEGRELYTAYLHEEQRDALELLASILPERKTVLMCVEDDPAICHRTVIIDALRTELSVDLEVVDLR